ncbi:RSU1, partial [Cervus elaphus hippelaphus]
MNRLNTLPRGFGSLPALEVLDLTYNNLNENSLPGNFFYLTTLRALYLSDNDFEILPPDIGKLTKLQIVSNLSKFLENQFTPTALVGVESRQFEPEYGLFCRNKSHCSPRPFVACLQTFLSLRDNDLISLPKEIGELTQLKELHIQGNRLTVLPPE